MEDSSKGFVTTSVARVAAESRRRKTGVANIGATTIGRRMNRISARPKHRAKTRSAIQRSGRGAALPRCPQNTSNTLAGVATFGRRSILCRLRPSVLRPGPRRNKQARKFYDFNRIDEARDSSFSTGDPPFGIHQYTPAFRLLQRVGKMRALRVGQTRRRKPYSRSRMAERGRVHREIAGRTCGSRRSSRLTMLHRRIQGRMSLSSNGAIPSCRA